MKQESRNIVFLSSSLVNLAKIFAENHLEYDVFLVLDRRFPYDVEDEELDNFYSYVFDKRKLFEKNREQYFDSLGVYVTDLEPDIIITDNFTKLLPKSFVDFMKFRNPRTKIINIHHGDLSVMDKSGNMEFKGLNADVKQMLTEEKLVTTIHLIEDEGMDTGERLAFSHPTTLKELKARKFFHKKEDILNLRIRNVVISYHERSKVLKLLGRVVEDLIKE